MNTNLSNNKKLVNLPFKFGDELTVKINAFGLKNVGLAELPNGYTVVVSNVSLGDVVKVKVEKIFPTKPKYITTKLLEIVKEGEKTNNLPNVGEILEVEILKDGPKNSGIAKLSNNFTILVPNTKTGDKLKIEVTRVKSEYGFGQVVSENLNSLPNNDNLTSSLGKNILEVGSKFTMTLPRTTQTYSNFYVVNLKGSIVFVKMALGVKLGDTVRVKTIKTGSHFVVVKILKIAPLSAHLQNTLVKNQIRKMIQTGMHFGEKAIRCHANMRKYVWIRKKGMNKNRPLIRRGRHLINVLKTRRCLMKALQQLSKYAVKGKTFIFIGTKKPAASLIARTAMLTRTSFFVNTRWLGGMLTNWKAILKSIAQIRPILKEKQKIIKQILEKRQKIQKRLIKKMNLLRKRSQKLMLKGKALITKIQENKSQIIDKSQRLVQNKTILLERQQLFIQKYQDLNAKQKVILEHYKQLVNQRNPLIQQKQIYVQQLLMTQKNLKEFKTLFKIGQELLNIKKQAKEQGKKLLTLSYSQLVEQPSGNAIIPNPTKELLSKMIESMKIKYNNSELSALNNSKFVQNKSKSEVTANTVLLTKFLNKYISFLPFIKSYIETLILRSQNLHNLIIELSKEIHNLDHQLTNYTQYNENLKKQLSLIQSRIFDEQNSLELIKTKLKRLAAEQRLLKFLPKLRYLPTPKKKLTETIQILMKKFVDPKLVYPMDFIYDEKFKFTSKKMAAARKKKWQRLEKYFGGITRMAKMSKNQIANQVAIIVGQNEEMNAVRECKKLGIKIFSVVDTNCNPKLADHIIPANDDSRNSIKFILGEMLLHIRLAQKLRKKVLSKRIRKFKVNI
jgi:ribosomal protein S2